MGRIDGSVQKNSDSYDFYIIWEETDINVANNTSRVIITFFIQPPPHKSCPRMHWR